MKKTIAVIQARMGSTRLPGKVLLDLGGQPVLQRVIDRARRIPGVDDVLLATSVDPRNQPLRDLASTAGIAFFAGSEADVLDRYYQAARAAGAGVLVRITADCPLLDPAVSGLVVARFLRGDVDYASNIQPPTYPDGLDTEVFSFAALERAWKEATLPSEREHVTPYIRKNPDRFRLANVVNTVDLSGLRWTVDYAEDIAFARAVYSAMAASGFVDFGMKEALALVDEQPQLCELNRNKTRNEGHAKSLVEDSSFASEESHS